jgi:hypothetical protein
MNKRVAKEPVMSDDNRIVKLESDVQHLQSDVTEIKGDLKTLKTEFLTFKAEVAKEFGAIRTSIERTKLWMVVTGVGTILSVWGAALALARFLRP